MPIEIKYIGTQQRWPELATTGKQSVWMPGQIEERDDVEAGKLLATGLFKTEPVALTATLSAQGVVLPDEGGRKAIRSTVPKSFAQCKTFVLGGDSLVQYGDAWFSLGPYNLVNDGSGTLLIPAPHTMPTGTRVKIVNSKDPYWSQFATITRIDANQFTIPLDPRAAATLNSTIFPGGLTDRLILLADHEPNRASPFHCLNAKLGMPWRHVANIAANGMACRDMLLRLDDEMAYLAAQHDGLPDAFWGSIGANDTRVLAQSVEIGFARVTEYMRRVVEDYGMHFVYQAWHPNDSRDAAAAVAGKAAIRLNRMVEQWALSQRDVTYMPTHGVILDPTSTLGHAKAGLLGTDGVHHLAVAADMEANYLFDLIGNKTVPFRARHLPNSVADCATNDALSRNKFSNPLLLTTGGTVGAGGTAGTTPKQVTITTSGASTFAPRDGDGTYLKPRTVANDGDAYGNNLVIRATFAAAGDYLQIDAVGDATGHSIGDKLRVGCHLKTKLVSGARPRFVSTYHRPLQDAVQYNRRFLGDGFYVSNPELERDTNEVHLTYPFPVTGAITGNVMRIYVFAAAAGVVDVEVGRVLFETIPA